MESLAKVMTRNGMGRSRRRPGRPLRLITYLAPKLFWFYEFISGYLARKLDYPMELEIGSDYAQLAGQADLAFVCGLPYVEHRREGMPSVEPLAVPVLLGMRYGDKPVYFSDIIVRRHSSFRCFADLRGCSWSFNEPLSQSGYGIMRYQLVQMRETNGYFSRVVETGYHERSIRMVCSGEVDASAIDSHVLALVLRDEPTRARQLRIIESIGPSPIQPIVAGSHLSKSLKSEVKRVLLEMGDDPGVKPQFEAALVKRFEPASDSTYDDIRRMRAAAEAKQFLTIR